MGKAAKFGHQTPTPEMRDAVLGAPKFTQSLILVRTYMLKVRTRIAVVSCHQVLQVIFFTSCWIRVTQWQKLVDRPTQLIRQQTNTGCFF